MVAWLLKSVLYFWLDTTARPPQLMYGKLKSFIDLTKWLLATSQNESSVNSGSLRALALNSQSLGPDW